MGKKKQKRHHQRKVKGGKSNTRSLSKFSIKKTISKHPVLSTIGMTVVAGFILYLIIAMIFGQEASEKTAKEGIALTQEQNDLLRELIGLSRGSDLLFEDTDTPLTYLGANKTMSPKYEAGLVLYDNGEYENAAIAFEQAIGEQEKISGVNSNEVGVILRKLGKARVEAGKIVSDDGNGAIDAFSLALAIFRSNDNNDMDLGVAFCYNDIAQAYSNISDDHYSQLAINNAEKSINEILKFFGPEKFSIDVFSLLDGVYDYGSIIQGIDYYETYLLSLCSSILSDNFYLLGGIIDDSRDYQAASLYVYNNALKFAIYRELLWGSLVSMAKTTGTELDDEEIEEIIQQIQIIDEERNGEPIQIKVFDIDINGSDFKNFGLNDLDFDSYHMYSMYASADLAMILTSRAAPELFLGYQDQASEDCNNALKMWERIGFPERWHIASTYIGMAALSCHESDLQKFKEYTNSAISYDRILYGNYSLAVAADYYFQGISYMLVFEDYVAAKDSLVQAQSIYLECNDKQKAEKMEQLIEINNFLMQ